MTLQFTLLVRNYSLGWSELRLINNKVYQVLGGTEETRRMSHPAGLSIPVLSLPQLRVGLALPKRMGSFTSNVIQKDQKLPQVSSYQNTR